MAKLFFKTSDGKMITAEADGGTLMEAATEAEVPGITADCGGVGSCSTCHVHVHPDWIEKTGKAEEMELDTLEFSTEPTPCSRLSCQIEITDELDGLVVDVPEED